MRPVRFLGETLGLEVAFDAGNTVELTAGNGDRIQLFGPGQWYFEFYRSHGDSIVPLLEVDDLDQARPSLPAAAPSYSASGVRRHLDLAHLPGARREHPQPGVSPRYLQIQRLHSVGTLRQGSVSIPRSSRQLNLAPGLVLAAIWTGQRP